jgi:hypothetical protein
MTSSSSLWPHDVLWERPRRDGEWPGLRHGPRCPDCGSGDGEKSPIGGNIDDVSLPYARAEMPLFAVKHSVKKGPRTRDFLDDVGR